jgi:hypothetical protein
MWTTILFFFLTPAIFPDCSVILTGGSQPRVEDSCIEASNCRWTGGGATLAMNGGAVNIDSTGTDAKFTDCNFDSFSVSTDFYPLHTGGALYLACPTVFISRCCAYNCSARFGNFVRVTAITGTCTVEMGGCLASAASASVSGLSATQGGEYTATATDTGTCEFTHLNSSFARAVAVSGIHVENSEGMTTASYLTFCNADSDRVVWNSGSPGTVAVSMSNFYSNKITSSDLSKTTQGVIYGLTYGISVESCVFSDNTRNVGMSGTTRLHTVRNCWFAEQFPEAAVMEVDEGNTIGATASHQQTLFLMFPNCIPPQSPIHSATARQTPEPTPMQSPVPMPAQSQSSQFEQTSPFVIEKVPGIRSIPRSYRLRPAAGLEPVKWQRQIADQPPN